LGPVCGLFQRDVVKRFNPPRHGRAAFPLASLDDRGDPVQGPGGAGAVVVVGAVRDSGDRPAVAVDAEARPRHAPGSVTGDLVAEQPPAQEHALAGGDRDEPAVEGLELALAAGAAVPGAARL